MLKNENKLKDIIIKVSRNQIAENDIYDNTNLINEFGFNSVQVIEMIVEIEINFNIELDDEDMNVEILTNYSRLKDLIIRKIND